MSALLENDDTSIRRSKNGNGSQIKGEEVKLLLEPDQHKFILTWATATKMSITEFVIHAALNRATELQNKFDQIMQAEPSSGRGRRPSCPS